MYQILKNTQNLYSKKKLLEEKLNNLLTKEINWTYITKKINKIEIL